MKILHRTCLDIIIRYVKIPGLRYYVPFNYEKKTKIETENAPRKKTTNNTEVLSSQYVTAIYIYKYGILKFNFPFIPTEMVIISIIISRFSKRSLDLSRQHVKDYKSYKTFILSHFWFFYCFRTTTEKKMYSISDLLKTTKENRKITSVIHQLKFKRNTYYKLFIRARFLVEVVYKHKKNHIISS